MKSAVVTPAAAWTAMLVPWRAPRREVLRRLDEVMSGSLLLVIVTVACVGAAMADQAARQATRLLGDQSFIGPEYIVLGVQEFGPLMVCVTLAMRVGAGFSAELAALSAEQTLDALHLFKTDPVRRLLTPMAVALPLGAVALGLIGIVVWELCGIVTLMLRSQVNPFTFLHPEAVTSSMLVLSLTKTASFGVLIYLGAATAALRASAVSSGSEAVGRATQHAVVLAVLFCLLANLVIDILWFLA